MFFYVFVKDVFCIPFIFLTRCLQEGWRECMHIFKIFRITKNLKLTRDNYGQETYLQTLKMFQLH